MRMLRHAACWLGLVTCLALQVAAAQARSPVPARRWALTAAWGGTSGLAGRQLSARMQASGLDDPSQCWLFCSGTISHPFHSPGGLAGTFGLSYALREPWALRFERVKGDLGETLGYKYPFTWMFLRSAVETYAFSVVLSSGSWRLGVGPAWHTVTVTRTDMPGGPPSRGARLGAVAQGAVSWPSRSRFFLEAIVQRSLVGAVDIGPFTSRDAADSTVTTIPRTPVSFSYSSVRMGFGVRW